MSRYAPYSHDPGMYTLEKGPDGKKWKRCAHPGCEYTSRKKDSILKHYGTHTTGNKFKCDECELEFTQRGALRRHKHTHNPAPSLWPCPHCGRQFRNYGRPDNKKAHTRLCVSRKERQEVYHAAKEAYLAGYRVSSDLVAEYPEVPVEHILYMCIAASGNIPVQDISVPLTDVTSKINLFAMAALSLVRVRVENARAALCAVLVAAMTK